jgi:DNA-binding ferritin-like protein
MFLRAFQIHYYSLSAGVYLCKEINMKKLDIIKQVHNYFAKAADIATEATITQADFLFLLSQLKIFHWNTKSFAQHKSFGEAYDSLSDNVDEFIELWQGEHGLMPHGEFSSYAVSNNTPEEITNFIAKAENLFVVEIPKNVDPTTQTNLLNARDEMLSSLSQLKYLLTLS